MEKFEIMAIRNRYKDTFDDLINTLDLESPDWLAPINEGSRDVSRSANSSTKLLKGRWLYKDISDC